MASTSEQYKTNHQKENHLRDGPTHLPTQSKNIKLEIKINMQRNKNKKEGEKTKGKYDMIL